MQLTPVMERYVLHWGEMGARWGVNRSVAQIHALLYLSPDPLTAEDSALAVPMLLAGEQPPNVDLVLGLALER